MTHMNYHEFVTVQRPRHDELPTPVERPASQERLVDRALRAVLGVGSASSSAEMSGDV
jgi:hypothetical protein